MMRAVRQLGGWPFAIAAALVSSGMLLAPDMFGRFEGRFWPVVTAASLTEIQPVGENASRIYGTFDKLRECDFDSIEWRVRSGNAYSVVAFEFEEASKAREPAPQEFGPWLIHLTPAQLKGNAFAVVYHRCGVRPWLTETHFYP